MKKYILITLLIILLSCDKDNFISLEVFPNPVTTNLNINYKMSNENILIITDSQNNEYYRKNITDKNGTLIIDMSDFKNKVYYIKLVKYSSNSIQIKKIN